MGQRASGVSMPEGPSTQALVTLMVNRLLRLLMPGAKLGATDGRSRAPGLLRWRHCPNHLRHLQPCTFQGFEL